jgi:hypothetical protein
VGLTHGKAHHALAAAVRTILNVLPELIEQAKREAILAHQEGRATDLGQRTRDADGGECVGGFVWHAMKLLAAAEPFRPLTARRDIRGAWHGAAILMAFEVEAILRRAGKDPGSFEYKEAPIVRILMKLLSKTHDQVIGVLGEKILGKKN